MTTEELAMQAGDIKPVDKPGKQISHEDIYNRIYAAIIQRSLPPGVKLSEEKLAKVFGVSRTRIREVLYRLAHEKIVTLVPNRGAFVASPSAADTREVFEARRAIEGSLVRIVTQSITPKRAQQLRKFVAAEHAARSSGDRAELAKLTGDFHLSVAKFAGNSFLFETLRGLVSLTRLIIYLYDSPRMSACLDAEHDGLLELIEKGDVAGAEKEMITHLNHIEQSLDVGAMPDGKIDLEKIFA